MKRNNKEVKSISKLKNVYIEKGEDKQLIKSCLLIEFQDLTYNAIDLKSNLDITKYNLLIDKNKSRFKYLLNIDKNEK